jgi:hypothetical protein
MTIGNHCRTRGTPSVFRLPANGDLRVRHAATKWKHMASRCTGAMLNRPLA